MVKKVVNGWVSNKKVKINKRNTSIDVLRGLCILAVILLHLNIHFGFSTSFLKEVLPSKLFSLLFWSGFYGVVIFFTLSGYLITQSILKKWGALSSVHLKTFYWFRFARIFPMLLLLLVVLSILHSANVPGFIIDSEKTSLARAVFSALTFHTNWLEIQVGYLPANWDILWSISIEETFYLIFPLVCLFLKKDWHFIVVLVVFLLISPWARTAFYAGNELGDKNHLAFIDSIVLGCMAAILAQRFTFKKSITLFLYLLGFSMVTMVVFFKGFVYKSGLADIGLNITILSLGIGCMLLHLHAKHQNNREKKPWALGWLRQMGLYSYEMYLTHMFAVLLGVACYKKFQLSTSWLVPVSILIILTSYFLGLLLFRYFSEPLNLWLRKKWKHQIDDKAS